MLNPRSSTTVVAVLWLGLALGAGQARAAEAATPAATAASAATPLPLRAYLAPADFADASLSADGRYLAALAPIKGKRNLVVMDLQTRQVRTVTAETHLDVVSFKWVGSSFLVYTRGLLDSPLIFDEYYVPLLHAIRPDGSTPQSFAEAELVGPVPGSESEILLVSIKGKKRPDMYRVDLENSSRRRLTFDQPGYVVDWVLDQQGLPRAALVIEQDPEVVSNPHLVYRMMLRDTMTSPWRELARWREPDRIRPVPRGFAPDNRQLIVSASPDRDTMALYLFDPEKRELGEQVAAHPRFDAGEFTLITDRETGQVTGLDIHDDRHQTVYFDADLAALQSRMEAQFPGLAVKLERNRSGTVLVSTWSDRQLPHYYLYDPKRQSLALLLRSSQALDEGRLAEMRPFLLKTRDGVEIPSYVLLPPGHVPGQRRPAVVVVHDGPDARAGYWGPLKSPGVREAQLLASRGYVVVLSNFRMTPGLGRRIYEGGFGQVGRRMSDDHEDAAQWAVAQGFADAKRICISGGSYGGYGGYAALWATIRSAQVFKCAVAGHPVSQLELQLTRPPAFYVDLHAIDLWRRMTGDSDPGWARSREVSPALHAERSTVPLFIYAGQKNNRTSMEQTEVMVSALAKAGRPAEVVMVKRDGYGALQNRVDLYEAMLQFLDKHIGTGPTP